MHKPLYMIINKELNDKLRKRYSPDNSKLRQYQMRLLDTLIEFDKICRKHNIKYWISCGTLLGVRRHGGFIPWDDDIDIDMPLSEYKKLMKVFKENKKIVIQDYSTDKYYHPLFPKIRDKFSTIKEVRGPTWYKYNGCFIDLFVLEDTFELPSRLLYWYVIIEARLLNRKKRPYSKSYDVFLMTLKKGAIGLQSLMRMLLKYIPGKHFGYCYGCQFYRNRLVKSDYDILGEIEFEGYKFPCPKNVDLYLEHMYGDWQSLPDLDNLHPHLDSFEIMAYPESIVERI